MVLGKADLSSGKKPQVIEYKSFFFFFFLSSLITLHLIFFPSPKLCIKVSKAGLCEFPIEVTSIYPLAKREVLKGFSRVIIIEWHYSTINIVLRLKLYKCHGLINKLYIVHCFKTGH